jgi:RNA polymerase-binding protein DksA
MSQHDTTARKLHARLEELEGRAQEIENDLRHPLDADSSERAIDLSDDEALAAVSAVLRREIADIRAALSRIEDGSYGFCDRCGEEIAPARLEALPTATRCINCA